MAGIFPNIPVRTLDEKEADGTVSARWKTRCRAVTDLDAVAWNIRALARELPERCALMAVVKGDGYGLGLLPLARTCCACGVPWLGTATLEEAEALRRDGLEQPILILGPTPPERAPELVRLEISQLVHSMDYALALSRNLKSGQRLPPWQSGAAAFAGEPPYMFIVILGPGRHLLHHPFFLFYDKRPYGKL